MILSEMGQCGNVDQKKDWKLLSKLEQKDTNTTEYVSETFWTTTKNFWAQIDLLIYQPIPQKLEILTIT